MDSQRLHSLLEDATTVSERDLSGLKAMRDKYPFFSASRILLSKTLHARQDLEYSDELKVTALHIGDRSELYRQILRPGLVEKIKASEAEVATEEEMALTVDDMQDDRMRILEEQIIAEAINASILLEVEDPAEAESKVLEQSEPAVSPATITEKPSKQKDVSTSAPRSFMQWLGEGKQPLEKPAKKTANPPAQEKQSDQLIEQFIAKQPAINPQKNAFFNPSNVAKMSVIDKEEFVTETLAGIYAKQGNYDKAIRAYEQLALKYPEKSIYFANLIKKIRSEID